MQVDLNNLGKHYNNKWVFKQLNYSFKSGKSYAVVGSNGSGKSTLIKILAGLESSDDGTVLYNNQKERITNRSLSLCAPYTQAIMEFSALENLEFAQKFKPLRNGLSVMDAFNLIPEAKRSKSKELRHLSSGMAQRVKILLALMSDVPLLLLDEPLNNLDEEGYQWYHGLVQQFKGDSTLIIASNNKEEYSFCDAYLRIGVLPLQHGKIQDLS